MTHVASVTVERKSLACYPNAQTSEQAETRLDTSPVIHRHTASRVRATTLATSCIFHATVFLDQALLSLIYNLDKLFFSILFQTGDFLFSLWPVAPLIYLAIFFNNNIPSEAYLTFDFSFYIY